MDHKRKDFLILLAGISFLAVTQIATIVRPGGGAFAESFFWNAPSAWAGGCAVNADCDDENSCTADQCELGDCTFNAVVDGTACDDGDVCTLVDACAAGLCEGVPTVLGDLCPWALVLRQSPTSDSIRTGEVLVAGDVCAGWIGLGAQTLIEGDLVSADVAGLRQIRLPSTAHISGDTVSGGAGVTSSSGSGFLPQLAVAVSSLPPGSLTAKISAGVYDLTGLHPLASACADARNGFLEATALLDALPSSNGTATSVDVASHEVFPIVATAPGAINVFDFVSVTGNSFSTIALDGGGHPETVMVLRISKHLKLRDNALIVLTNALTAENTLLYVRGRRCLVSNRVEGSGSLLCSDGKVRVGSSVSWTGAILGGGRKLSIGDHSSLEHVPFQGF